LTPHARYTGTCERRLGRLIIITTLISTGIACPRENPDPFGVRNAHALIYDGVRGEVILFGGADETAVRHDTWSWNGVAWRRVATSGPAPRTFPAAAYDADARTAFIFGGNRVLFGTDSSRDTFLADLWGWDGQRWQQRSGVGPMPAARAEAVMIYDQKRRRLVLFGGYRTEAGRRIQLGDTWEWDGTVWTLMSESGPTPRNNAAMAYDPVRGVAVLFGGSDGVASGETWEWDGSRWMRIGPPTEPRYNSVMVYDEAAHRIVRFGGWYSGRRWGDTWAFDGTRWIPLAVSGPSPRNHAAFAYDSRRHRGVLVGGHDGDHVFGDVWEWLGDRWVEVSDVRPRLRVNNGQ
jgi:hypothetical protein